MSDVIKRDTIKYIKSKHDPDCDPADYIILNTPAKKSTALTQFAATIPIYRKIVGDDVVEMDQGEKDAVDLAINAEIAQTETDAKDIELVFDKTLKAFALVMLDEINKLRVKDGDSEYTLSQLKTAITNKYDTL